MHPTGQPFIFFCRLITTRCKLIAQVELIEAHRGWTFNFFLEQRFHRMFNLMFLYLWGLVLFPLRKFQRKKSEVIWRIAPLFLLPLRISRWKQQAAGTELSVGVWAIVLCQENWEGHRGTSSQSAFGQKPCQGG